jgi:hypothetical protein
MEPVGFAIVRQSYYLVEVLNNQTRKTSYLVHTASALVDISSIQETSGREIDRDILDSIKPPGSDSTTIRRLYQWSSCLFLKPQL